MTWYPVYVEVGDETHAHSMVVPDFPGCFSAADEWEQIPAMVQEALEVWIAGEDVAQDALRMKSLRDRLVGEAHLPDADFSRVG